MWRNYLKIGLGNFVSNKLFSFINVFGLAAGLASVILIGLYVAFELSYDEFHPEADRVYRVMTDLYAVNGGQARQRAVNNPPAAELLKADFAEIVESARLMKSLGVIQRNDLVFSEPGLHYADPALFRIFGFEWLQGDPATALDEPNAVVLTESLARKYFGDADPIGQTLRFVSRDRDLQVTGVIRDLPENSHMAPTLIVSIEIALDFFGADARTSWERANSFHTYVKLAPGADVATLAEGLPAFVTRRLGTEASATRGMSVMPVTDIHLHSARENELEPPGSMVVIVSLITVAAGILLIACFNFMNLATARALMRGKEVGVRKTMGAERKQLALQFLGESVGMTLLATLVAIGIVELLLPAFNGFSGLALRFDLLRDTELQVGLLALMFIVGCVAGSYPALYLSSFKPAQVLRQRMATGNNGLLFRNLLVVLQFSIAIVTVVSTSVVALQNRYARNLDLGFDKEQVVVLTATGGLTTQWEALKTGLLQHPEITDASASSTVPGGQALGAGFDARAAQDPEPHELSAIYVDYGFFETYGIELLAGRFFSEEFSADRLPVVFPFTGETLQGNFVINESTAREFGWTPDEAIGQQFDISEARQQLSGRIVGVVGDSHFESLYLNVKPLVFFLYPPGRWGNIQVFSYAVVRITGNNVDDTLAHIDRTWRAVNPDIPIERSFLSDRIDGFYQQDTRLGKLLSSFATLAIVIACLGLFGLATFNAQRRMKEIGVRKVMGGSVWQIVFLLTSDFSRLVLLSNVIAWPVAYFAMERWLQNFAYRIDLTPLVFVGSGLIALCIAWVTVGGTAAKAASQKPVLALRYE